MRRILLGGLMLLASTSSLLAAPWKVTPGGGVGPISLGGPSAPADAVLARDDVIQDGGIVKWIKYKGGLEIHLDRGKVLQIVLHDATLSTKQGPAEVEVEGVTIGSPVQLMERTLGRDYIARDLKVARGYPSETYYAYTKRGVGFIARQGKIFQIAIWPKKP